MDFVSAEVLNRLGAVAVLMLVALLVISDKLVWHTRLKDAEKRAERWEGIAFEALTTSSQAGIRAAEVTADVISALPVHQPPVQQPQADPVAERIAKGFNP